MLHKQKKIKVKIKIENNENFNSQLTLSWMLVMFLMYFGRILCFVSLQKNLHTIKKQLTVPGSR